MKYSYIVSYDLHGQKNYDLLIKELERLGARKVLLSCWVLSISWTAIQVRDHLLKYMDADDSILVVQSSHEAAWKKVLCDSKWLVSNL